jgi:hypothetical protein
MSYFVFGFIDLAPGTLQDADQEGLCVQSCASAEGLSLRLGKAAELPILGEMRGPYRPGETVPFLITRSINEDTSDALISPYVHGIEEVILAIGAIGRWLVSTLLSTRVECVRMWMTEGYDDSFQHHELTAEAFAAEVAHRVREAGDVPSLRLTIA